MNNIIWYISLAAVIGIALTLFIVIMERVIDFGFAVLAHAITMMQNAREDWRDGR